MSNPYDAIIPDAQGNLATGASTSQPTTSQPAANPYDDIIPDTQRVRLRASLSQGVQANPAQVAQQRQAAGTLGVPPAAVEAMPGLQQQAQVQQIDEATQNAPVTREAFTNPDFAKIAHPDADRLAKIEGALKYAYGLSGDSLAGDVVHDTLAGLGGSFNTLGKNASTIAGALPTIYDKTASVLSGKTNTSAEDWWFQHMVQPLADNEAAFTPGQGFGHKALHAVGGLLGTLSQIVLTGGESAAPAVGEVPSAVSAITANIQHALKAMALPATNDAVSTAQRVYEATGDSGSAIRAAQAQYAVSTLGGAAPLSVAGRLATRVLTGFGVGAVQGEASREAMNLVLPGSMQQQFDPQELALSGIIGMGMAGAMGPRTEPNLYPAIRQTYVDAAKADQAAQSAAAVDVLSKLAEESELRSHDPATFKQLIGKMAEDPDALKAVYVKGSELDAAVKAHGVTDADLAQTMPEVAKSLAEARTTDGDVRIPIADYATHIAGSELDPTLRPHLRVDPEGMTTKEAEDYYGSQVEQFQKTAETAIAGKSDELQRRGEADAIRDTVAEQLQAAGRTPAAAKVESELARTFFATMSERAGMTPKELFDKSGFNVTGGVSALRPGGALEQAGRSLDDVRAAWDAAGISHSLSEKDGTITVGKIVVPEDERGTGKGTAAMKALTDYADATGQHIALSPAPDFGGNVKRLKQFYKRFGFVENKGKNRAFSVSESMYRQAAGKVLHQDASGLPRTVEVDGARRPIEDANGRLVGRDFGEQTNFWKWFGESKATDDSGRPQMVYHGTPDDFHTFSADEGGKNVPTPASKTGFFFTDRPDLAQRYAEMREGTQQIMPAYLSLKNPTRAEFSNMKEADEFLAKGYEGDGAILKVGQQTVYAVKDPTQIKSATGNNGKFDPTDANILHQSRKDVTQSESFKRWFGDSKIVDANGKPLVTYHGSPDARFLNEDGIFATMKDRMLRYGSTPESRRAADDERGFFFTSSRKVAASYADDSRAFDYQNAEPAVVPAYLALSNPLEFDAQGKHWREAQQQISKEDFIKQAKASGHDGVVIRNVRDSYASLETGKDPLSDVFVAFDSRQIKSATKNDGSFDANDPSILSQQARGSFSPDSSTVRLLKDADLSTFTHEFGHFALETLNRLAPTSEALATDRDTIFKWLGVKDGEAWNAMSLDEQRPFHEQFARGFESYLMEGKAPAAQLQGVFGRIRSWMLSVYQHLKALDVELTPEVRGVFDRLLATDEAIRAAEQTRGYFGLDKLPEGVKPEEAEAYRQLGGEATQQAISDMAARSIRDMRWLSNAKNSALRKLQGEAKAARQDAREQATREVDDSPAMKAKAALEALEAEHEKSPLSADMNAQLVAEAHGFQTVDAMHRAITQFGDREAAIANLTDLNMLQQHGELTDPRSIELAAEAAIHNDARARFMATGLKILTKSEVPARQLAAAAKEAAERIIAGKTIASLRPDEYSAAEARANKQMLKAAPASPADAVAAQRAALLNNRLYKAARDAVDEVRKALEYVGKFDKDAVRQKIDLDIRDQIDDLLERFDFRKTQPGDERLTREQQNLQQWLEAQRAAGYQPSVSGEAVDARVRMHYADLTVEKFRGLVDSLKALEQVGRERKTITVDGKRQELNAFVEGELVPKIRERGQNFTPEQLLEKPELREGNVFKVALDHFNSWLRSVGAQLKPTEFKRNEYDRHEILGPFGRAIFERVAEANYRKLDMLKGLSRDFGAMAEKLGRSWQDSLRDAVKNDVLVDPDLGRPMAFTRGRMLGMALHVGNESNFDKLARGWGWSPETVMKFLKDNMSANDWHAVQSVWDLYEKHWPQTEAMYRRLGQTIPDKIPARGFTVTTPDGQLLKVRGGYAAITYDPLRSRRGEKQASGESIDPSAGLFGRDYFSRNTPTNGSMNARVAGYTDRVSLDYGDVARKLQESIHDLAYRETLIDAHKIIEHAVFRQYFREAYGLEAYKSLQEWLGRLANSSNMDRSVGALGKFLGYTRTGMVINAIAFRATTVLKHGGSAGIKTLGYFAGGGETYLASRMAAMAHDYSNQIAFAREKFPEIRARLMQQDRDFRATSHALFEKDSKIAQAERFGHAAVAWSDMMTAVPTANAAYDRAIAEGIPVSQGGTGKPMTEEQAVAYASKVVREAHGTNIESGRSMVLNTDSEALKMFTTLYGFMNNTYGQMADSVDKLRTAGISNTPVLARTFMAMIVPALWAGYLKGGPSEDKGEGWGHWMAAAIAEEVAATVPLVRDAAAMVEGYKNAGMVSAESWVATMVAALKDIYKGATDPDHKGSIVRDVANAVGMGLHLPGAGQAGTSLQYLENVREGKEAPQNAVDAVKGLVTGHGR